MSETISASPAGKREVIAFRIGEQEFCADIMAIREIRGWTPATPLPHAEQHIRGVINLRGVVLPILDMSERFGFGLKDPTPRNVIIVAQLGGQLAGLLVDAVLDILTIDEEAVQPPPSVASDRGRSFVRGVLAIDGRMITAIELDQLIDVPKGELAS